MTVTSQASGLPSCQGNRVVGDQKTVRFFCDRHVCSYESPGNDVIDCLVSGDFAGCSLAHQTVNAIGVYLSSAWARVRDTKIQAQSQGNRCPNRLIVQTKSTGSDRQSQKPVSTVGSWSSEKGGFLVLIWQHGFVGQNSWSVPKWFFIILFIRTIST